MLHNNNEPLTLVSKRSFLDLRFASGYYLEKKWGINPLFALEPNLIVEQDVHYSIHPICHHHIHCIIQEYGISLTWILPYKDGIYDFVPLFSCIKTETTIPIRESTGQRKLVFSHFLCSDSLRESNLMISHSAPYSVEVCQSGNQNSDN